MNRVLLLYCNSLVEMISTKFNSILDLLKAFPDEQSCTDYLEEMRWGGKVVSPFKSDSKVYECKNNRYKCKDSKKYFNVKTGTMFESSNIPLQKWFLAMYLETSHKKGISSTQLSKDIDVTQKTSWFILQRIRNCFGIHNESELSGEIEVDETYVGGKNKNRHKDKKVKYSQGRSYKDKTPVFGAVQRGGMLIARVVPDVKGNTLKTIIYDKVALGSTIHSDEWFAYNGLSREYEHKVVEHGKGIYGLEDGSNTNRMEGAWSHLKRMIIGVYHSVSRKHLQHYVNEFVFRYNTRHLNSSDRFNLAITGIECRLTYKQLIS